MSIFRRRKGGRKSKRKLTETLMEIHMENFNLQPDEIMSLTKDIDLNHPKEALVLVDLWFLL